MDPGSKAERRLAARLARLREQPTPEPPAAIEAELRAQLAARRARVRRTRLAWLGAGLATATAAVVLLTFTQGTPPAPLPAPVAATPVNVGPGALPASPRPGHFRALHPAAEPADLDQRPARHVARVEMAAATAVYLGLPVAADVPRGRIQAEVLYGEDGVAHGLRLLPASFRSLPLPSENEQGVQP